MSGVVQLLDEYGVIWMGINYDMGYLYIYVYIYMLFIFIASKTGKPLLFLMSYPLIICYIAIESGNRNFVSFPSYKMVDFP